MYRVSLLRGGALRLANVTPRIQFPRRGVAWLAADNEYLPNLLAADGYARFLDPVQGAVKEETADKKNSTLYIDFSIDRNAVCIKGNYKILDDADKVNAAQPIEFNLEYPPYDPDISPPTLPRLTNDQVPFPSRIQELADTTWRSFCSNDFLSLQVDATLRPDGSMSFARCTAQVDESAVHRQAETFKHVERTENGDEVEAEKSLLVFRKIPGGTIGTIVNGAGLAMATNDTIDLLHGRSANFLDAGGKATPETIKEAFRLVLKNPQVKVILVNVFGGVIQGDMIATGILAAISDLKIDIPVVARVQGTNGDKGMQMLRDSEFHNIRAEDNLYEAVQEAVKLSNLADANGMKSKDEAI